MPPRPSSPSSSYLAALALVVVSVSMSLSMVFVLEVAFRLAVPVPGLLDRSRRGGGDGRYAVEERHAQPCRHAPRGDERACLRRERGDLPLRRAAVARRV